MENWCNRKCSQISCFVGHLQKFSTQAFSSDTHMYNTSMTDANVSCK